MNKLTILIPCYKNTRLAKKCINSVIKLKLYVRNLIIEIIISDDSPYKEVELYLKKDNEINKECIFINREKQTNEFNSAVHNWNFLLKYSHQNYPEAYTWLVHHDELIVCRKALSLNLNYSTHFLSLSGIANRRKTHIGSFLFRIIISYFPKFIFNFNIVGPTACLITKEKVIFDTNLKWLVDVDYYYKILLHANFKYKLVVNNTVCIETMRNDNSITNEVNIPDLLRQESSYLKITGVYKVINLIYAYYKHLKKRL